MALRRITSRITSNTFYRGGIHAVGQEVTFTIILSEPLPFQPAIQVVDTGIADRFVLGFGFSSLSTSSYTLSQVNSTTYTLVYRLSYNTHDAFVGNPSSIGISVQDYFYDTDTNEYVPTWQRRVYLDETDGETPGYYDTDGNRLDYTSTKADFNYGLPPARLEIHADTAFIANGETIPVTVYWNYSRQTITAADIVIDEGTVSNVSGSGNVYSFDLTAPATGAGAIEVSIDGIDGIYRYFAYAPPPDFDLYIPAMKYPPPHLPPADETLYVTEVAADDLDDKNDFTVLIPFQKNVNGLSKSDIEIEVVDSNGDTQMASILSLEGRNSVYEVTVRPPTGGGSGVTTIRVPENVVDEGNPEKAFAVAYSDEIAIPDWEVLFTTTETYKDIVSVNSDGIELLRDGQIDFFDFKGRIDSDKQVSLPDSPTLVRAVRYDIDKYLGLSSAADPTAHLFVEGSEAWKSHGIWKRDTYNVSDWAWTRDRRIITVATPPTGTDFGVISSREVHQAIRSGYDLNDAVFETLSVDDGGIQPFENWRGMASIAHGDGRLFVGSNEGSGQNYVNIYDAENNLLSGQRIPITGKAKSLVVSDGWLYRYDDTSTSKSLMRFSLDALRLPEARKVVYPQLLRPGDTIDLSKLVKYAERISFDVGFDKPEWLSIEDNYLKVDEDAPQNATAYVRLRGINYVGDTEKGSFGFYIYIRTERSPQWKSFASLSMYPDQKLNMFAYCDDADTIEWPHGFSVPSHLNMSNGVISVIGDFPETATQLKLRARSIEGYFQDYTFDLFVIEKAQIYPRDTPFRYRIEIEGIDITSRLLTGLGIQNSLDLIRVNRYTVADCNIPLRNDDGYFRYDIEDNFWRENDLNPNGFLNNVKVYKEFLVSGVWESELFFEGQITKVDTPTKDEAILQCFSNTTRLTQIDLEGAGIGIEKIAVLESTEVSENLLPVVEGTYTPETGLAPLSAGDAQAFHHTDCLNLKDVVNDALGIKDNSAFLSASDLKTQGGTLDAPVLLNFKTAYRYQKVRTAFEKLTKVSAYLTSLYPDFEDLPEVEPHISVCGNIQFNTEPGRITRLPVDWILDETARRLYVLLSNPAPHIRDQLVEYRIETDSYHVLREFDASEAVYRIASSDYDTFYILCGASTDIDKSDPNAEDTQAFTRGFDSSEPTSKIKVLEYARADDWLETFIDTDDENRPQLGVHYHFGFPNRDYAWQGIVPSRQSAFLVQGSSLYYRYATDTEFGVARANPDGTTESLVSAEKDDYDNHLNFAFSLDADDNVYFAYTQGTHNTSTLHIEKHDGTAIETLATISRAILELTDLEDTGAFLGVHEMVFLDDYLYMVVPVARGNRNVDKSAGSVLYRYGIYTKVLEKLDSSDFVHFGFAGLTVHTETGGTPHDAAVYYVQSPAEVYKYPAYNPDLENYDSETTQNYLPDFKGNLKRVLPTGEVEDCGAIRFDAEGAFRGLVCRCLSVDNMLHLMVAQGDPDAVLQKESAVSLPSSVLWCAFSRRLNFALDEVPTTGTLDSALVRIASQANATFGINQHITTVQNRSAVGALLKDFITEHDVTLDYDNANRKVLPESGHILIDGEVISFAGRTGTQLTGLQRAQHFTDAHLHAADTTITFLDKAINENDIVSDNIFWSVDRTHLYNTITDRNRLIKLKDALSPFSEKVLDLDFGLHNLQIPMLAFIAGDYLHRFKDIRFLLTLSVSPSLHLKIGDVVGFHYKKPIPPIAMQIMQINYTSQATEITGRQTAPHIMPKPDPIEIDPNETFRILDGTGSPVLVDGKGDHTIFAGGKFDPLPTQITFERAIDDLTLIQFQESESEEMPKALGGAEDFEYFMEGLPVGMFFDPKTRLRWGTPEDAQPATPVTYTAIDKNGTPHRTTYMITVNAVSRPSRRILDGLGNPVLVDGKGDHTIFEG